MPEREPPSGERIAAHGVSRGTLCGEEASPSGGERREDARCAGY